MTSFSLTFGLSPYFGLSSGLSERLIQKVKSQNEQVVSDSQSEMTDYYQAWMTVS